MVKAFMEENNNDDDEEFISPMEVITHTFRMNQEEAEGVEDEE